jgi:N-acetyl-gamma-glutamyl-phosphate reductase
MTEKLKIAIVGATGYTGGEMVRLLAAHPSVEIAALTSRQFAGRNIADIFPALRGILNMPLIELDMPGIAEKCDAVFLAVPHTRAMPIVAGLVREGMRVVDYSADFRLKSRKTYEQWYQSPHTESVLLSKRVYGLPELYREELMNARLVALPGCYPTGALLALAPAVKHGIIDFKQIVINSMSGVSGAGQTPTAATHFPEIADNLRAYGVTSHRHTPEIDQAPGKR